MLAVLQTRIDNTDISKLYCEQQGKEQAGTSQATVTAGVKAQVTAMTTMILLRR